MNGELVSTSNVLCDTKTFVGSIPLGTITLKGRQYSECTLKIGFLITSLESEGKMIFSRPADGIVPGDHLTIRFNHTLE